MALFLAQCASRSGPKHLSGDSIDALFNPAPPATARAERAAPERPGLGTKLGDKVRDNSVATTFYRKAGASPDAVATFHYNDDEGARLMAQTFGRAVAHRGAFDLVPGKLRVSLSEYRWGTPFNNYSAGGQFFVAGVPGSSYVMKFENLTHNRLEIVVSVDGLDVRDGQPASKRKPGYVIAADSKITIDGMKVNGQLRELLFASVAKSRAATAFGESGARNVGVIGVACYEEDEAARRRVRVEENYVRGDARAFGN